MKTYLLAIAACIIFSDTIAQNNQPGCYPYPKTISVNGSAEMEIIPDEIYVQVNLREYKKKGEDKVPLDRIKNDFLSNCRSIGISENDISVASYDGYNMSTLWRRKKRDPDMLASIIYQVKFSNLKKIDELVDRLDDDATSNFFIARTSHSKITEYRKQLKIMAVKAAREKAGYLCEATNEQLGQAITIVEPEEYTSSDVQYSKGRAYSGNVLYEAQVKEKDNYSGLINSDIDYRKIKLRFEVKVLYALK